MSDLARFNEELLKSDSLTSPATISLTPAQLYKLCNILQLTEYVQSSQYRELDHCKTALACKNRDIVRESMPRELYGRSLELGI